MLSAAIQNIPLSNPPLTNFKTTFARLVQCIKNYRRPNVQVNAHINRLGEPQTVQPVPSVTCAALSAPTTSFVPAGTFSVHELTITLVAPSIMNTGALVCDVTLT